MKLVLASKSPFRAQLLQNAGLEFAAEPARIDERSVEQPLVEADLPPADIAEILAIAKADDVSGRNPGALVIGSDQILAFEGEMLHKPEDMEAARRRLLALSGKAHQLHASVVLVQDGETKWSHVETATIRFRLLSPQFIGRHLASVGDKALSSVGAYQIEGEGVQLVEKIEGDFFTIMGLPLLPLLAEMRRMQVIGS
jgi:septum formation protein